MPYSNWLDAVLAEINDGRDYDLGYLDSDTTAIEEAVFPDCVHHYIDNPSLTFLVQSPSDKNKFLIIHHIERIKTTTGDAIFVGLIGTGTEAFVYQINLSNLVAPFSVQGPDFDNLILLDRDDIENSAALYVLPATARARVRGTLYEGLSITPLPPFLTRALIEHTHESAERLFEQAVAAFHEISEKADNDGTPNPFYFNAAQFVLARLWQSTVNTGPTAPGALIIPPNPLVADWSKFIHSRYIMGTSTPHVITTASPHSDDVLEKLTVAIADQTNEHTAARLA